MINKECGRPEKKLEIQTKTFNKGFSTISNILQMISDIGFISAKTELTNPPKLITERNGTVNIFANTEYKLILLK